MMRIAHIADIQINASSKTSDRTKDTRQVLFSTVESLATQQPHVIVIAGDIFERHETNDNERTLYIDFVNALLAKTNATIIVIDGNHDIRHKLFDYYDGNAAAKHENVLSSIAKAINNSRYLYSQHAKVYHEAGVDFGCWSELAKFCPDFGNPSPWIEDAVSVRPDCMKIDVYHGTAGSPKAFANDTDLGDDGAAFASNLVLLGHIHMPQVISYNGAICYYSSSLLTRAYDEGIRMDGKDVVYDYRGMHGYMLYEIDVERKTLASANFVAVHQPTSYATLVLRSTLSIEDINEILAKFVGQATKFKLVIDSPSPEVLSYCYNAIEKVDYWKKDKVESVIKRTDASSEVFAEEKLSMDIDTFVRITTELLAQRGLTEGPVFDKTLEFMKQECGYHLHPDTPQHMVLDHVHIENFKTIDVADLAFDQYGLFALSGNNGNGKTTCIEAICFACTGQQNATFKHNAKKEQYIKLFNDKRPELDAISIEVKLRINATPFTIAVNLNKVMAPGWTVQNWKSYVRSVQKSVQIIDSQDIVIAEGQAADDWLMANFGSYADFAILHCISQSTLDMIATMDNDALANYALQRLGYSVLSKLQYFYDGCKNNALAAIQLTDQRSYMDLQHAKDSYTQTLTTKQADVPKQEENVKHAKDAVEAQHALLETLHTQLVTVPTEQLNTAKARLAEVANAWKQQPTVALVDQAIAERNADISNATTASNNRQKLSDELATIATEVHTLRDKADADVQRIYNERTASIRAKIDSAKQVLDSANARKNKAEKSYNKLKTDFDNEQRRMQEIAKQISGLDNEETTAKQTKQRLEVDRLCPTCGQKLQPTPELQASIDKVNADLARISSEREKLEHEHYEIDENGTGSGEVDEAKALFDEASKDVDTAMQEWQAANNELTTVSQDAIRTELPETATIAAKTTEYNTKRTEMQAIIVADINSLRQQIEQLQGIKQDIQFVQQYEEALRTNEATQNKIDDARQKLTSLQQDVAMAELTKQKLQQEITDAQAFIDNLNACLERRAQYDVCTDALKQYKWLINDGLPKYLYCHAVSVINNYIDSLKLPSSICPRLSADQYGMLTLVDRAHDGTIIVRPIQLASGMELTLSALVLCLALHHAKLTIDFPMLLIDEISGKLNEGKANDTTNYLHLFEKLLKHAAEECQILLVDHRLDESVFDKVFTVVKGQDTNTTIIKESSL